MITVELFAKFQTSSDLDPTYSVFMALGVQRKL